MIPRTRIHDRVEEPAFVVFAATRACCRYTGHSAARDTRSPPIERSLRAEKVAKTIHPSLSLTQEWFAVYFMGVRRPGRAGSSISETPFLTLSRSRPEI